MIILCQMVSDLEPPVIWTYLALQQWLVHLFKLFIKLQTAGLEILLQKCVRVCICLDTHMSKTAHVCEKLQSLC